MRTIKHLKRQENGSIMLEVVAVLALMGVMGAMLFRQIYQRNQELHNIQMASEIRTVKEAFSAYIQANRAAILDQCPPTGCVNHVCEVNKCGNTSYEDVAGYLPDGWFTAAELEDAYYLTLWNYKQDDSTGRHVVYGIVVPTEGTLPVTGWNFRRAARVALLVGADGGAYDKTITSAKIAGALGSWEIEASYTGIEKYSDENTPTYAAMTGIDIFAPEYEAPEGNVGLPKDWSLALNDLHAYNYFSVGSAADNPADCYHIASDDDHKRKYNALIGIVETDTIVKDITACKPLFWVGSDSGENPSAGNVYVQNDLNVGADMTGTGDHALKLTAEGVIKQKDGLTIDKDGRIIARETVSTNIGDLKAGEHFVLDPAYTSTMNDIRLASRGGVRLSEILPNYILKEQYDVYRTFSGNGTNSQQQGLDEDDHITSNVSWVDLSKSGSADTTLTLPTCPTGYKKAVVVIPTYIGGYKPKLTKNNTTDEINVKTKSDVVSGEGSADGHTHTISKDTELNVNIDKQFVTDVDVCQPFVSISKSAEDDHRRGVTEIEHDATTFFVTMGYRKSASKSVGGKNYSYVCPDMTGDPVILHATVQTYCVWYPSLYDGDENKCKAAGYDYSAGKCTNYRRVGLLAEGFSVQGAERDQYLCQAAGFKYIPYNSTTGVAGHCQYEYVSASEINSLTKITSSTESGSVFNESDADLLKRKAAVCKAAGFKWNGTECLNS